MNSSLTYPEWLEEMVKDTGNELLYEAYSILDAVLPRKERIRVRELVMVFDIDEVGLKRAGFFFEDELTREELIRELIERSNYYRWG